MLAAWRAGPVSAPLPGKKDSFNLQVGVRKRGSYSPTENTWKLAQGKERLTLRKFSETCWRALTSEISSVLVPATEIAFWGLHSCCSGSSSSATVLQPCQSKASLGFALQKCTFDISRPVFPPLCVPSITGICKGDWKMCCAKSLATLILIIVAYASAKTPSIHKMDRLHRLGCECLIS